LYVVSKARRNIEQLSRKVVFGHLANQPLAEVANAFLWTDVSHPEQYMKEDREKIGGIIYFLAATIHLRTNKHLMMYT
jgi:hypothetical protein